MKKKVFWLLLAASLVSGVAVQAQERKESTYVGEWRKEGDDGENVGSEEDFKGDPADGNGDSTDFTLLTKGDGTAGKAEMVSLSLEDDYRNETAEVSEGEVVSYRLILKATGTSCKVRIRPMVTMDLPQDFKERSEEERAQLRFIVQKMDAEHLIPMEGKRGEWYVEVEPGEEIELITSLVIPELDWIPEDLPFSLTVFADAVSVGSYEPEEWKPEPKKDRKKKKEFWVLLNQASVRKEEAIDGWKKENEKWYHLFLKEPGVTERTRGWYDEPEDGRRYYLDPETGWMRYGRTWIDGREYYFMQEHEIPEPTWSYDMRDGKWHYSKVGSVSFGSLMKQGEE